MNTVHVEGERVAFHCDGLNDAAVRFAAGLLMPGVEQPPRDAADFTITVAEDVRAPYSHTLETILDAVPVQST